MFKDLKVTGTEINYYFVCPKKLWLFSHGIQMEHTSDRVYVGKLIHEDSFGREDKEILIDGVIKLDFIKKSLEVHETKASRSMPEASLYQVLYYMYYLKNKGVEGIKGYIHYPKSKRKDEIILTAQHEERLKEVIGKVLKIRNSPVPEPCEKIKICSSCSYYDLCFC